MNQWKNNYLISLLCTLCLWIVPNLLFSQYQVKYISNVDGLSNNSVNCFFEDAEHLLWIGTWDGLNVYNGSNFKTYRYNKNDPHSISNNIIRQIVEQDKTSLWITTDFGVNRWDRNTQQFEPYYLGTEHKMLSQEKSFLLGVTSQKSVVCHVNEQGLFFFDEHKKDFIPIEGLVENKIETFVITENNNIYFLTNKGHLVRYSIVQNNETTTLRNRKLIEDVGSVSNIFLSDNILIADYGSFIKIFNEGYDLASPIYIADDKTISDIICHNNSLFISFYEGSCVQYDLNTKKIIPNTDIPENISIFTLFVGSQDILWIGTDGQGIIESYKYSSSFQTVKTNYPVRSICEDDDGNILVGTKGEGIKSIDKKTNKATDYLSTDNGLISNSVYAIKKNMFGDIFIGTEGAGVNIIRRKTKAIEKLIMPSEYPYFKAVYNILFTHNDSQLWLGTTGFGLIRISIKKRNNKYVATDIKQYISSSTPYSLNNNTIYAMAKGKVDNELWIGTRGGGLSRFDIESEQFNQLEGIDLNLALSNNDVISLMKDDDSNFWVGTSYGLNLVLPYNSSPSTIEYARQEEVANKTIHGILKDRNNNIWVSTNHGVSLIETNTKKTTNYTSRDGLHNNEFADGAYYKDTKGQLFFGGVNGLTYFDPDNIELRSYMPTLSLNKLRINNTNLDTYERIKDDVLRLSYDEAYLSFTFAAHDFINNENCEFKYRVLNFSEEWIDNGNNPNIAITKLPPGGYQLEVKATNGDRMWNENIYTLDLDVAYPWWLSIPAFVVYFLLVSIIIYVVQSTIRNRIRLNRQLLLEHIEKQHQLKIHESKLNFFTNVAHEFFTPLTLIYGPAQHLLEKTDLDSYTKRYIQIIKNNGDRMYKLINELMEFRKAESGHTSLHAEIVDIKLLIEYVSDNYTDIIEENKINFNMDTGNVSTFVTDRNSLEKIIFNLISNAFKYTPSGGYINVKLWIDEDSKALHFQIRNSGRGLTDKKMSEIFSPFKIFDTIKEQNTASIGIGLNLTKSLTELLGGTIAVNSKLGEYVEFMVILSPMQQQAVGLSIDEEEEDEVIISRKEVSNSSKEISILVVEDEKNIRELLRDILSPYYNIREAENGKEALSEIEQNLPDIIISDILMPQLDGIALIDRLKSNEMTAHIPIISISAKSSIDDHINAYNHGTDLYITKPFHPRHVLSTVENIIKKHILLKEYFNSSRSSVTVKEGVAIHQEDEILLNEIIQYIENNIDDESLSPNTISEFIGMSKASLYRKLKELTNKTPSEFVRIIRLNYSTTLLKTTKLTVSEIIFKSGFSNKSYFYREFAKQFGTSPNEYRYKERESL